ncbi:MAG: hypothetical protein V1802_00090 [Candidatus Aenigmatarchaeota archaeon]
MTFEIKNERTELITRIAKGAVHACEICYQSSKKLRYAHEDAARGELASLVGIINDEIRDVETKRIVMRYLHTDAELLELKEEYCHYKTLVENALKACADCDYRSAKVVELLKNAQEEPIKK